MVYEDDLVLSFQLGVNFLLILSLAIYLGCTFKWQKSLEDSEEEGEQYDDLQEMQQQVEMRKTSSFFKVLAGGDDGADASVQESLLKTNTDRGTRGQFQTNNIIFPLDLTAIRGGHQDSRHMFPRLSKFTIDSQIQSKIYSDASELVNGIGNARKLSDDNDISGHVDGEGSLFVLTRPEGWKNLFELLYKLDERKLFRVSNPDGYFYLLFLKKSAQYFCLIMVFSVCVMIPVYVNVQVTAFDQVSQPQNLSSIEASSVARSLQDKDVMKLMLLMSVFFAMLAYIFLFNYCNEMRKFEFQPQENVIDKYIASHSLIIRGVNKQLGTAESANMIKRIFKERFGSENVVAVQTFRNSINAQRLYRKKKVYKRKAEQYKMTNNFQEEPAMIEIGETMKCNKRSVDAEQHYESKYKEVEFKWEKLKESPITENVGVAIVSFKNKDCVDETISEIDFVKSKLVGKPHYQKVNLSEWKIAKGVPPADIIWKNVDRISEYQILNTLMVTFCLVFLYIAGDTIILAMGEPNIYMGTQNKINPWIIAIFQYVTITVLVLFNTLMCPYLVYSFLLYQTPHRKSQREKIFMDRFALSIILNTIILPTVLFIIYSQQVLFPGQLATASDLQNDLPQGPKFETLSLFNAQADLASSQIIAFSGSFFIQYTLQVIMLMIYTQWRAKPEKILKSFHQMLQVSGKTKFRHFMYDISYRSTLTVCMFTFGLCFSVIFPLLMPLIALFFILAYYIDKYNFLYVYPVDFDSISDNRRALVVYTIFGIVFFQLGTIILASFNMTHSTIIYMSGFLILQVLIISCLLEFTRKPWLGRELEIEKAMEFQNEKLLESISSYQDFTGRCVDPQAIEQERLMLLKTAYEDPFNAFFTIKDDADEEQGDIYAAPESDYVMQMRGESLSPQNSGRKMTEETAKSVAASNEGVPTTIISAQEMQQQQQQQILLKTPITGNLDLSIIREEERR